MGCGTIECSAWCHLKEADTPSRTSDSSQKHNADQDTRYQKTSHEKADLEFRILRYNTCSRLRSERSPLRNVSGFARFRREHTVPKWRHRASTRRNISRTRKLPTLTYTLIWSGKQGITEKVSFNAEKAARDHALASFPIIAQGGIVAVEVRKADGTVVFSNAGAS